MALLYGTSKYTWKERQVELAGLLEGNVVKAGTICLFSSKTTMKRQFSYSWFQTFAVFSMLYAFFWVILGSEFYMSTFQNTLFHLHRQVGTYLPMKLEQGIPKRRHIKFRRPGNYQEESIKKIFIVLIAL